MKNPSYFTTSSMFHQPGHGPCIIDDPFTVDDDIPARKNTLDSLSDSKHRPSYLFDEVPSPRDLLSSVRSKTILGPPHHPKLRKFIYTFPELD